ncbi:hypothetical protein ASPZODRAFT_150590 [Penicilliopsis zonata CBS 506.65]|uniref:CHAT domain-containing protein n=1 Tax=Penicilliopsis zonata CBS 506.65 TaxID=1073090 RepID=A0A1L9SMA8_9EURO|nr:hypothetical protein ASPZODRAFT_150590 [Penicilliopsis zonata CBS 506.65]OJJ48340.1 hypothetical protein ASPZODRAFT_150590 [Penicilliopsis zonata CBS 506.65]
MVSLKERLEPFSDAGPLVNYLARLILELHLACRSPSAAQELNRCYTAYEHISDYAGMANCKMMEADSRLSPPFASPVSLNLIPADSASAVGEEHIWDPYELHLPLDYSQEAQETYALALSLFERANCERGQAAVLLRQACCLHVLARQLSIDDDSRHTMLKEAGEMLDQAQLLFGVDEANLMVVLGHQILLDISRGVNTTTIHDRATEIGKWGVDAGNEKVAHFIGLVMLRFAKHEYAKFSRFDMATRAYECAYECFIALGDVVPAFQTLAARAWMQHGMYNSAATILFIDRAREMFESVLSYYDQGISNAPDTELGKMESRGLLAQRFQIISSFLNKAKSMYLRMKELEVLEEWQTQHAWFIEHDKSFQFMREHLEKDDAKLPTRLRDHNLWQRSLVANAIHMKFAVAEITFDRHLEDGNLADAEQAFASFFNEMSLMEPGYSRDFFLLLAYNRVGDHRQARVVLNSMTDSVLFNDLLERFLEGRGLQGEFPDIAGNALNVCVMARDMKRGYQLIQTISQISPSFFENIVESASDFIFRLADYSIIMLNNDHPETAFRKLLKARELIELRRTATIDADARGSSLVTHLVNVFLTLTKICLRCEQAGIPLAVLSFYEHGHSENASWGDHALLFLEEARARSVLDSLQTVDHISGATSGKTLSEITYKRRALRHLQALRVRNERQEREQAQLEAELRDLAGNSLSASTEEFIQATNASVDPALLYGCIPGNAVVIEASFSPHGSLIFAITSAGIENAREEPVTVSDLRRPVLEYLGLMQQMTGIKSSEEDVRKRQVDELGEQISAVLLKPFEDTIRTKTHVIFSVSDPLTAFPLSALPFDGEPLLAHVAVSQIPSLTVLYHLSRRQATTAAPTVSVFAKTSAMPAVEGATRHANGKDGDEEEEEEEEQVLYMARIEAVNIARLFATWPIEASRVTRREFREYIQGGSAVLHIGTHGDVDHHHPLLSFISIGEEFRVLDLLEVQSRAHLLVFAACLSGLGRATLSNEVLGFTHVVLGTGCQAYIGTLWKVNDFGSMLLMTLFYRQLKDQHAISLAEAMRRAQHDMLRLDTEGVRLFLDGLLDAWAAMDSACDDHGLTGFLSDARYVLATTKMMLDQLDLASPFYWASFMLVGYGDFKFAVQDSNEFGIH